MNVYQNQVNTFLLAIILLIASSVSYADEKTQLTAIVRQLDLIQTMLAQTQANTSPTTSRYHFDYQRLNTDLARVRTGINDYLTPKRAQPRDAIELWGDYQQDGGKP